MIIAIGDPSQVGDARRTASELARKGGATEGQLGRIAIIATELATNIVKHAPGGGMLIAERYAAAPEACIELIAVDKGPGMSDVSACLADGFSTAGSPGTGLGAIERQADQFAVYSRPGLGTAVLARVSLGAAAPVPAKVDIGFVSAPYPGETVCGDKWAFGASSRGATLFVVDGSGHGPDAARAAEMAAQVFTEHPNEDCVTLVERMHRALAPTRGAALAVARVDAGEKLVRYVGVGNISGALVTGTDSRQMVSHNGTAGHVAPRIREFTYPFSGTPFVIMHSDGLSNRWRLADYPGLAACHPSLIAAMLFRDFRRGRDDATIAVMRAR